MLAALVLSGALVSMSHGVKPPEYTERSLCEVWAGAQCHVAQCSPGGKDRCAVESKRCRNLPRTSVTADRAQRVAACAKAMLKQKCGAPAPPECANASYP